MSAEDIQHYFGTDPEYSSDILTISGGIEDSYPNPDIDKYMSKLGSSVSEFYGQAFKDIKLDNEIIYIYDNTTTLI